MRLLLLLLFLLLSNLLPGQNLAGRWEGTLTQTGKSNSFSYQLDLQQDGNALSGTSLSVSSDGAHAGRFILTGVWDGSKVIIQEVQQTAPPDAKWCLKYMTLQLINDDKGERLEGEWKADGCTPGKIELYNQASAPTKNRVMEEELPFTMDGKWTGYLSQSDRDYGFYFEMEYQQNNQGGSFIVSEENGGSANMDLTWSYYPEDGSLRFVETGIAEKTDPKWRWCIKNGVLKRRRDKNTYILEGRWKGYIEGFDEDSGPCASGKLYLEKPVLTKTVQLSEQKQEATYKAENHRPIKVQRVIEVQNPNLRIKVWDNGIVDGDVVTLFLNGEMVLEQERVTKRKHAIIVKLNEENNFLILHAEDLGDIKPNTVAVSIDDGVKEHQLILSSNLRESGAVMIKQFKMGGK